MYSQFWWDSMVFFYHHDNRWSVIVKTIEKTIKDPFFVKNFISHITSSPPPSGYGNQAPITNEGRMLVVTAGLCSIILFGAVLGVCGYVLLAIFDDFVGRFSFSHRLGHPAIAMFMWGTIWLLYAMAIATDVDYWWQERLPEFAAGVDPSDALWFAYISTSTIGLGDYYLQPEVIFASDTLKYSVLFMIGFVFLSTFFGKIAECLALLLPKKHNSLEARLAATRVLACWPRGYMPWETKRDQMENVEGMVPDDQALIYRIEQVKALKPDPPMDEIDDNEHNRSLVSSLTGNPIHSLNIELLKHEESLLLEWLAVVRHQQQRALLILEQREQQGEAPREKSALFTSTETPSGSKSEQQTSDQTTSDSSNEDDKKSDRVVGTETYTRDHITPHPPPLQDDDMSTVISPAEEIFNPLANFFSSA